ncbi:protein kinase [Nocardia vinacea]|uniref:protein kinase n=1 Tax=Nocardia vinacea TaxID=96468 RepID=UPI0002FF8A6B|nr:protein kinase [Nocardia vinacea]
MMSEDFDSDASRFGPWRVGEVVADLYEVRDVITSGGMGLVYRVWHRGWRVELAVKTPRPDLVDSPKHLRDFESEAEAWVGLGVHPNTVSCAYVRRLDDPVPQVFAEWVDGGSLADAIRHRTLYEGDQQQVVGRLLDVAIQFAWGLEHAHEQGLIHQDVKPANVMLTGDGIVKVTDFGLAKARAVAGESASVRPGPSVLVGFGGMTPAYCSPEQALAGHDASVRLSRATDVWSWAISVWELFAGGPPCRFGQTAGEVFESFVADGGTQAAGIPSLPPQLAVLLRQCFAADPTARPRIEALADGLTELYTNFVGEPYPRSRPVAAELLADGLSNKALSLLDLGRQEEAEKAWQQAVAIDPHHLPSVYNFGLYRWRSGLCTGEDVVSDLQAARAADTGAPAGLGALLLGTVQLERDDERAEDLLREAAVADPSSPDCAAALVEWERRPRRIDADFDGHAEKDVSAVAVNADGSLVISGDRAGRLLLWSPGEHRPRHTLTPSGLPIAALAIDDAGTVGAAVREDGRIELWDLERGRAQQGKPAMNEESDNVAVAMSGDGRYVATGSTSGTIRVWALDLPRCVATLPGHIGPITSLALSGDGRRALSASFRGLDGDCTVRSWDVAGGRCIATLTGPVRGSLNGRDVLTSPMDVAAVSQDARWAVVAWWHGPRTLWDASRGTVVSEVPHRLRDVTQLAVHSAGPTVLTAGDVSVPIRVWDARTGRCLRTLDADVPAAVRWVRTAAVAGHGRVAVLGGNGIAVARPLPTTGYWAPWCYVRPRSAGELTRTAEAFGELVERARHLAEQGQFASAAAMLRSAQQVPGFARHPALREIWAQVGVHGRRSTLRSVAALYSFDGRGLLTQPPTLALREDGLVAVTGCWTGEVDVWDCLAGEVVHTFDRGEGGAARDIQFAVDGMLLAVLTSAGTIRQLSLRDWSKRIFTDETGAITAFAVTPTGDRILIGDENGALRLRNLPAGEVLRTLQADHGKISAVAVSSDARSLATHGGTHPDANRFGGPSGENVIHLWSPDSERPAWTLPSRSRDERLAFSADGRTLFVYQQMFVGAWDVGTGELRYSLRNDGTANTAIAFSADGIRAATSCAEGLQVWATATGEVLHTVLMPSSGLVFALSSDGSFLVTGGWDRLVRVWDVGSGRCLQTLDGHQGPLCQVALSRDDSVLATVDLDSCLRVWELSWDSELPPEDGE